MQAPLTIFCRKICNGTNGYLVPYCCHARKATEVQKPSTIGSMTATDFQGWSSPAQVRPSMKRMDPQRVRKHPKKSTLVIFSFQLPETFLSGIANTTASEHSALSGRLSRKIHRQPALDEVASAPPLSGPTPLARATAAPNMPWYFPLCRRDTTSETMTCATVIRPPPPTPEMARKTMSWIAVCESEEAREPRKNVSWSARRTYFRDQTSERRPYSNWNDVDVMKYPPAIQDA